MSLGACPVYAFGYESDLPSNKRLRRDECALGTHQNTTGELRNATVEDGAGYTCIKLTGPAVRTEIERIAPKYDDVIVDAGGRDTVSQRAAPVLAQVLLVPFVPRSFDIWTLDTVATLIQEIRTVNPGLRAFAFINRGDSSGTDNTEAGQLLQEEDVSELWICYLRRTSESST